MAGGTLKKNIRKGIRILTNPEKSFDELSHSTLEETMGYYIPTLIAGAIAAGLFSFIYYLAKATFFMLFQNVNVNYPRLINYSIGISTSLMFFYAFAGTFLLFILSVLLKIVLRHIKYTDIVKILLYSTTPLLFFSWIPYTPIAMMIWSAFLFVAGIKLYKELKIKKSSTLQRY